MITVRKTPNNLSAPNRTASINEMRVNRLVFFIDTLSIETLQYVDYAIILID
jgi:hypothetical protein